MENTIRIDQEFKDLIPPLTQEEFDGLEQNILTHGCRVPLDVWNDVLIDGHNRYTICQKHNLAFQTKPVTFADRSDAKIWIIRNQFDRRNLSSYTRSVLALKMEDVFKEKAKSNLSNGHYNAPQYKETPALEISPKLESLPFKATSTPFAEFQQAYQEKKPTTPINTRVELAKIAGVSENTIAKVKKIEQTAPPEIKAKVERGEMSINEAHKQIRRQEQVAERQQIAASLTEPTKHIGNLAEVSTKYRVILADPPWFYGNDYTQAMPGSTRPEDHYAAMPLQAICDLPVKRLTQDDAVLFLWVTSPLLEESFQVVKAWGFHYKTSFVWDKIKHNFGHYNSVRHELLLVCTKGSCTPDHKELFDSVVSIEREEHSAKPERFREIIDTLYPFGNRIELFARSTRANWDSWGNQL